MMVCGAWACAAAEPRGAEASGAARAPAKTEGQALAAVAPAQVLAPLVAEGERTQVMVLGSPHLGQLGETLVPSALDSLLDVLATYRPTVIAVEQMPPALIAAMEGPDGPYGDVMQQLVGAYREHGARIREQLGLTRGEAAARAEQLLAEDGDRGELILVLMAAYDYLSAALQWSYLPRETRAAQAGIPGELAAYLDGLLSRNNELFSVGLRLAATLGLQRMRYIDDHQDKDELYDAVMNDELLAGFETGGIFDRLSDDGMRRDFQRRLEQGARAGDLLPAYVYMNSAKYQRDDVADQWGLFLRSKLPSRADRSRLALWEVRNLNMVSHIRRASVLDPGGRILVIVGAAHKPFFDAYLHQMSDMRVVHLADFLPQRDAPSTARGSDVEK